jgi:predicted unusual protein kinase regulating ubiquinone biosynthesis (AarF/ABC1/UbiB family)
MARRDRVAAAAAVVGAAGAGAALALSDRHRRDRLARTLRIWRLTTRRGADLAVVKLRGSAASDARRRELEEQFKIRSAADVARELGNMKGVIMKAGQMLSFILDGLPEAAQQSLAALQGDVPPMSPGAAAGVVRAELGRDPHDLFLHWSELPTAAASIGQVHKAVLRDGRIVAVKVQYPGIDTAISSDLANAELLYAIFSAVALKSLDVKGLVEELRARMLDELDYRLEATCQADFARRYRDHPFIHVPAVIDEFSTRRVLTSEWVDGMNWSEFLATADHDARQNAAEVMFRFIQGSIYRARVFNGDPHPGNYRFHADGSVTFLDFGLVKRWAPGELESLVPLIDPLLDHQPEVMVEHMVAAGFLYPDHGLDPQRVWEYVSAPYTPYLQREFTFTPAFASTTIGKLLDLDGPFADVMAKLNLPSSFVILDRVVWGMSAILGRLGARNRWREILEEYRFEGPPITELGRVEARWRARPDQAPSDLASR